VGYAAGMRALLLLLVIGSACSKGKAVEETGGSAVSSTAPSAPAPRAKPGAATVALDHLSLLQPEALIEKRVKDQDELATSVKQVPSLVAAYDELHPGVLPASFDVVLVARPTAMRAWLVSDKGDVAVPDLERGIANMPRFAVTEGNVAFALSFVRAGTQATPHDPYIPAAWKAAAGNGTDVDQVIDKAWPQ
jgi:hypothetical protein